MPAASPDEIIDDGGGGYKTRGSAADEGVGHIIVEAGAVEVVQAVYS